MHYVLKKMSIFIFQKLDLAGIFRRQIQTRRWKLP